MSCPNRIDDDTDRPCGDEGELCEKCWREEAAKWARYFGLRPDMTPRERLNQLEQFRPLDFETTEESEP